MSFAHWFCADSDGKKKIVLSQTSNLMVQKRYSDSAFLLASQTVTQMGR